MRARRWIRPLFCGLFFLCFALARSAALGLENQSFASLRTLVLSRALTAGEGVGIQEKELAQEHPVRFVLWSQQTGVFVENRELNRSALCGAVALWGDSGFLISSTVPLTEDDWEGCLLDKSTSMTLFGNPNPAGSEVVLSGKKYIVRGVLESERPLAVVLAQNEALDRLTLRVPEGDPPQQTIDSFTLRNGISGEQCDPGMWVGLGKALSLLPAAVLMLGVIGRNIRSAFSPEAGRLRFWACIALAGGAWFLLLWLTGFRFQLPEDMIPNKWSDFDFWSRLLAEKRETLVQDLTREKTVLELAVLLPALRAGAFGVLAALLVPLLPRPATPLGVWTCCAAGAVMAFAAAVFMDPALAHDRSLWLALPAAVGCRWIGQLLERGSWKGDVGSRDLLKTEN